VTGVEVLGIRVVLGLIRHLRGADNWAILSTFDLVCDLDCGVLRDSAAVSVIAELYFGVDAGSYRLVLVF
jgi:hypothetical protein